MCVLLLFFGNCCGDGAGAIGRGCGRATSSIVCGCGYAADAPDCVWDGSEVVEDSAE